MTRSVGIKQKETTVENFSSTKTLSHPDFELFWDPTESLLRVLFALQGKQNNKHEKNI